MIGSNDPSSILDLRLYFNELWIFFAPFFDKFVFLVLLCNFYNVVIFGRLTNILYIYD